MSNPSSLRSAPNLLSLSRLPLAAVLFACISYKEWPAALGVFAAAGFTDWLDGWLARRWKQESAVGRALDPLTDKVLVCGAFIYLLPVERAELAPWMVTLVVAREVVVTGLRGLVEATGVKFGADIFGKLKTVLQMATLVAALVRLWLPELGPWADWVYRGLLYAAVATTAGSGVRYAVKAARVLG